MDTEGINTWTGLSRELALHTRLTLTEAIGLTAAIEVGMYPREIDVDLAPGPLFGPLLVLLDPDAAMQSKGHAVRTIIDIAAFSGYVHAMENNPTHNQADGEK